MDKFLMICYVAADFQAGGEVFSIKPNQIGTFVETPCWVKDTLLFKWLLQDGSIKIAEETISKKQGENDPTEGIAADGKKEEVSEAVEAEITAEAAEPVTVKRTRSRKTKKDDAE